jgi:hypothetical protein
MNAIELILWTTILICSRPAILIFFVVGSWKLGFHWIIGLLVASFRYGSLFWPFGIVVYIPTLLVGFKILLSREDIPSTAPEMHDNNNNSLSTQQKLKTK